MRAALDGTRARTLLVLHPKGCRQGHEDKVALAVLPVLRERRAEGLGLGRSRALLSGFGGVRRYGRV